MAKEATMSFYAALGHAIISIPKEEKLIVLEDVNARVGKQHGTWEALDLYGIEKRTAMDYIYLNSLLGLILISNTFFHQKREA